MDLNTDQGFTNWSTFDKGFVTAERDNQFRLEQDVEQYTSYAEKMREKDKYLTGARSTGFRPFCIIPDIVAIELKTKYGIDIHAPEFMSDEATKKRFAYIVRTEFPMLLTSAAANLSHTGGSSGIIIT